MNPKPRVKGSISVSLHPLTQARASESRAHAPVFFFFFITLDLELRDTKVYEP